MAKSRPGLVPQRGSVWPFGKELDPRRVPSPDGWANHKLKSRFNPNTVRLTID